MTTSPEQELIVKEILSKLAGLSVKDAKRILDAVRLKTEETLLSAEAN